jgi:hypothetical protein
VRFGEWQSGRPCGVQRQGPKRIFNIFPLLFLQFSSLRTYMDSTAMWPSHRRSQRGRNFDAWALAPAFG